MQKSLTIITNNERSRLAWKKRISEQFQDEIQIKAILIKDLREKETYYDDLVLITHPSIEKEAISYLRKNTPYILAKRTLDLKYIHRISEFPGGSDVLILNDGQNSCYEMIEELISFGFDQFHYYVYGDETSEGRSFSYAITDGEGYLMPQIPNILDFGNRQISYTTIGEISKHFFGEIRLEQVLFNRYISPQIYNNINLYKALKENKQMQTQLTALLAEFDNGIIMFNANYEIMISNEKALSVLPALTDLDFLKNLVSDKMHNDKGEGFYQDESKSVYWAVKKLKNLVDDVFMLSLTDMRGINKINKQYLRHTKNNGLCAKYHFNDILGKSEIMKETIDRAKNYAYSDANILIIGESGTGKELFAQSIHNASSRREGPFVAINCAALSETLLESELFGYEEGAFTGAKKKGKQGLFELAHKGTLFLDEIGNASSAIQQKLLRAIQEKEIFRISGSEPIWVDVRIIAATNVNLLKAAEEGTFRKDLFYRLSVMILKIPALKQRGKDVLFLFKIMLHEQLERYGITYPMHEDEEMLENLLLGHSWDGNVRELENLTEMVANELRFNSKTSICAEVKSYWSMIYSDGTFDTIKNTVREMNKEEKAVPAEPTHLVLKEDTERVLRILKELERDGRIPGRSAVLRYCRENGIALSEQQIKLRIIRLKELGLVSYGPGYSGRITEKGEASLQRN